MSYDNSMSFVLFKNDKEGNEQRPDYTGKIELENGRELRLAAWIKEGNKGKFMAGKVSEFQAKQQTQSRANDTQTGAVPAFDESEDVPF